MKQYWLALMVGFPLMASAAPSAPSPNPTIVLYEQRLQMELNELDRQRTNSTYTAEMKNRLEPLYQSGALPEATIKAVRAELDLSDLRVKFQESRVKMAEAMVDIAKARILGGREMPFCSLPQVRELNDSDWELPGLLKGGR